MFWLLWVYSLTRFCSSHTLILVICPLCPLPLLVLEVPKVHALPKQPPVLPGFAWHRLIVSEHKLGHNDPLRSPERTGWESWGWSAWSSENFCDLAVLKEGFLESWGQTFYQGLLWEDKGNDFTLKEGRFRLGKEIQESLAQCWSWWMPHPWKHSGSGWKMLRATWSSGRWTPHGRGIGVENL